MNSKKRQILLHLGLSLGLLLSCHKKSSEDPVARQQAFHEAVSLYRAEKYAQAESTLVRSGLLKSASADPQELMGRIRVAQIRDAEAVPCFRAALKLDSKRHTTWVALVQSLQRLGELEQASKAIAAAVKIYPNHAKLNYEAGQILSKQGQFKLAALKFEAALQADSAEVQAYYALGNTYRRLGETAKADAMMSLYEAMAAKAKDLEMDRRIIELNPKSAEAHYNLGRAYENVKDYQHAAQQYDMAIRLNPEFPEAFNNLGIIYFRLNQLDRALKAFQQALALSDTTAKYHFNLGAVYAKMGNLEQAKFYWRQTLKLNPHYEKAHKFLQQLGETDSRSLKKR